MAMSDGEQSARQYDAMAAEYATDSVSNVYNAYYERPATIALLGEVAGAQVMEVGCGAGELTSWLVDHGALVTAFDVSASMAELTRRRVGAQALVHVADVAQPLWFAESGRFDLVVACLVLHYVRDWETVFGEFRRVLKPDGSVIFSTHHPAMDWQLHAPDDYFAITQVTETWQKGSGRFDVTFWRRPLTAMCQSIASAGFVIERLVEPEPLGELAERDPVAYEQIRTQPRFLFFVLRPACHTG